jgi:hypothetical protein
MTDQQKQPGLFRKYSIAKTNGSPIDPSACYFVLRLDTDPVAREAMVAYAEECPDSELAAQILACVGWLENPPPCTCGGGRDTDTVCRFHDGDMLKGHPVWRYGEEEQ